ncbi:hypothetical protein [Sphingomonas sp.]|uniref:hypothetical protein n=1 Tax=Sphingomonas sp. TaxID=28214 RepID=UPI0031DFF897
MRSWLTTIAWRIASKFEESLLIVIIAHPCRTAVLVVQYTKLVPAASIAQAGFRQAECVTEAWGFGQIAIFPAHRRLTRRKKLRKGPPSPH